MRPEWRAGVKMAEGGCPSVADVLRVFTTSSVGESVHVTVSGRCTTENFYLLARELRYLVAQGALRVSLDLSRLEQLDATGLHALFLTHRQLRARGGQLVLVEPSRQVRRVVESRGLQHVFDIRTPRRGDHPSLGPRLGA